MSEVEFFPVKYCSERGSVNDHAAFFWKIVTDPHIMVSGKEVNWNSRICYRGYGSKKSGKTSWNNKLIFPPEIKDVSKEVYLFRIMNDGV